MRIGENIMRRLDSKGMNRSELAKAVGVTPTAICDIVKGYKMPSVPMLVKISKELDVSVDWILFADPDNADHIRTGDAE